MRRISCVDWRTRAAWVHMLQAGRAGRIWATYGAHGCRPCHGQGFKPLARAPRRPPRAAETPRGAAKEAGRARGKLNGAQEVARGVEKMYRLS